MARRCQEHFWIAYSVRGEKLNNVSRVNILLQRFTEMVKKFRIENERFKIFTNVVDDFLCEPVDTRLLKCSLHVDIEVIELGRKSEPMYGLSHEYSSLIHRELRKLFLADGTYTHKVTISVADSHMGSSPPMNSSTQSMWPKERF